MMPMFSVPWMAYIKAKNRLFGLMPLQKLVYKYHAKDSQADPLWTYWLFITYEAEVMEAIEKARDEALSAGTSVEAAEEAAYIGISQQLRAPKNEANHFVKKKVFLHLFGLVLISFLMVGIAGSNTMSVTSFLAENGIAFGAYTNIVTATLYVSAVWAQWMIFRRGVTKMSKSLFSWSNGGSDFFETAELEISLQEDKTYSLRLKQENKGDLPDTKLPGYYSRRRRTFFYGFCTAACAMAWGVLVYTKLTDGMTNPDGFFAMGEGLAGDLGIMFGVLSTFAACFLWLTALRTDIKTEEREERKAILDNTNVPKTKGITERPVAQTLLIAATLYALLASMLGQARIVFDTFGIENDHDNPLDPRDPLPMIYFVLFLGAIFMGRVLFSVKAMEIFYENSKRTWEATTWDRLKTEVSEYRSNYIVGGALILMLAGMFALSSQFEVLRKPMTEGANGHRIFSPMGIVVASALVLWTMFLVVKRFFEGTPEQADRKEAEREDKTAWFGAKSVRKGCEDRTGNGLIAAAFNGISFGGIGGKGVQGTIEDIGQSCSENEETPRWVEPTAVSFASAGQFTLAVQSFTTSTQARGVIQRNR